LFGLDLQVNSKKQRVKKKYNLSLLNPLLVVSHGMMTTENLVYKNSILNILSMSSRRNIIAKQLADKINVRMVLVLSHQQLG